MDHERQPAVAGAREQALEAAMICMTMGDHDRAQVFDGNAEHIEVFAESIARQPRVIEEALRRPVGLHRQQRRQPALATGCRRSEVVRQVPLDVLDPAIRTLDELSITIVTSARSTRSSAAVQADRSRPGALPGRARRADYTARSTQ